MGLDLYHYKATLHPANADEATTFREDDFDEYALDVLGFRRFIQTIPDFVYPTRILIAKDQASLDVIRETDSWMLKDGVDVLLGEPRDLIRQVDQIERTHGLDPASRGIRVLTRWTGRVADYHGFRELGGTSLLDDWQWDVDPSIYEAIRRDPPTVYPPVKAIEWLRDVDDSVCEAIRRDPPTAQPPVKIIEVYYPVPADYRGLYAEEVGYQRKGMLPEFYENFGSPSWYVRLADVQRAATFLDLELWDEAEDVQKQQEYFDEQQEYFDSQFLVGFEEGTSIFYVSY
jgi:hypothetical protein